MSALGRCSAVPLRAEAMKVSKIAKGAHARYSVFAGGKEKTYTGLKKSDLMCLGGQSGGTRR